MDFSIFAQWALSALLSGAALTISYSIKMMLNELKKLSKNVAELNSKIAVVIERQDWHQKDIDRIDRRLEQMENKHQ